MSNATCYSGGRETDGALGLRGQRGWLGEDPGQTFRPCLKTRTQSRRLKKKKKKKPEPFNGGKRGYEAPLSCSGAGATGAIWR